MKKKDKQKLINYAIDEYSKIFGRDYKPIYITKKKVKQLLKEYSCSTMCEWSYCCYGLYRNCWQEPFFKGNWGMTQKTVNDIILGVLDEKLMKKCRTDGRMFSYEEDGVIHVLIIARDLTKDDYLITFSNMTM